MRDPVLQKRFDEALAQMERGPGVPCRQAQADGFPCPELGYDCTDCDYGRTALLDWIAQRDRTTKPSTLLPGGDW